MLKLSVLDHELMVGPVSVDREPSALSVAAGVAEKPVESVLPGTGRAEVLVAQVEDVYLVAVASAHMARLR